MEIHLLIPVAGLLTLIIAIQQIAEVAQLYANHPVCSVLRLEKELKAFEKVFLKPGETKTIELIIKVADLAFYDEVKKDWNVEAGEFVLHIGNSSNNISEKIGIAVR